MQPAVAPPIGHVESDLVDRTDAPRQPGAEAPSAWLVLSPDVAAGLVGLAVGDEIVVLTWLHLAARDVLEVHPRGRTELPVRGVFATRSPDRPNPIGLHRVIITELATDGETPRLGVDHLEAIDGTPVLDIKPVRRG
jgi:tRNA-Thr(GGU) m(6)t(6)A37 methyltransferase TsaA